jgi:undecaprenyl-diphosphatase
MQFVRKYRLWIMAPLLTAVWLAMLLIGGPGTGIDRDLGRALIGYGNPDVARAMSVLTWLGGWQVLTFVTIPAAIFLIYRRRRRAALLLVMVFFGRLLVELQKWLINRPRPGDTGDYLTAYESMSYPSGHAANSLITYLAIALLLPLGRGWRGTAILIALLLSFAIGVSRAMVGAHWPTDVVGGWAFGMLWILVCVRLATPPEGEPGEAER